MLISSQVAKSSKETLELLQSEGDAFSPPSFVDALGFEELLSPNQYLEVPPMYTEYQRGDLDAVIMHSSGTTGLPKPIFHGQAYILIYAACHRLPEQREPFRFNVSTLPLYHVSIPNSLSFCHI